MARAFGLILIWLLSGCAAQVVRIPATDPAVGVMGRTAAATDGSRTFGYPGVTFRVRAEGSRLNVNLRSTSGQSWLMVRVDGNEMRRIRVEPDWQRLDLFAFPAAGIHEVEISHLTESWQGLVTLGDFTLDGKRFLTPSAWPDRRILVLGDSVTCGEAIDRVGGEIKNSAWWNATESYGALVARALQAQVHLVCWGGRGLVRTWDNDTRQARLAEFFALAAGDADAAVPWDHRQYAPDLILSAIGTNDFAPGIPAAGSYVDAYVALLQKLRANHPRALIVLTEGAILSGESKATLTGYILAAIERVQDPRVHYLPSNNYPGDLLDFHPNREQHRQMAADLVPPLRALLGWQ